MISEAWSTSIQGKPDNRLKQKIKFLKEALKSQCKPSGAGLKANVLSFRKEKEKWDYIVEDRDLSEAEVEERNSCLLNLISVEKNLSSMLQYKARSKRAIEGDENTKYYHAAIKYRLRKNNIKGLQINGFWSESPAEIKAEAFKYFSTLFMEPAGEKPTLISPRFCPAISNLLSLWNN